MKRKYVKTVGGKTVIGILATDRGYGSTHLAIAMANFIAEQWGYRTAVVERNKFPVLKNLYEDIYNKRQEPSENPVFEYNLVAYFPSVHPRRMADILDMGYEYYILDLGSDYEENREEFIRADKKILIGSCCRWKRAVWRRFILEHMEKENMSSWKLLVRYCSESDKKEGLKLHQLEVTDYPDIMDPFHPKEKVYTFLNELM